MTALAQELGIIPDATGKLQWAGVDLSALAQKFGTPLYVYNADLLQHNWKALVLGLKGLHSQIFYATKANTNGALLRLLGSWGAGADVVSGGELYRAHAAGIAPDRIVFSGVGKTIEEIRAALAMGRAGIRSFNVESAGELALIQKCAAEMGRVARVALRLNPDVNAKTHPYISTGLKKNKFGMASKQVIELCKQYGDSKHVAIGGLSIHIGSQIQSLSPLREAFHEIKRIRKECERVLDRPLLWLDLGGGLGVRYQNEKPPTIAQYTALIQKEFGREAGVELFLEPGRSLIAQCGLLLTEVLYRKESVSTRGRAFLVVDAAMTELLRPALYGSYHEIIPLIARPPSSRTKLVATDVVGPVCETADFLGKERRLSATLDTGSQLAILSAGAYGFSMASQYNSRPLPAEVLIQQGKFRLIRKRQTNADLIREEQGLS